MANDAKAGEIRLSYEPALDGLRGLAIIAVMIFHLNPTILPGGFIGVDIFFVLSGFLITFLLMQEFQQFRRIHLRNFYLRRVLRLAPALIFMLIPLALLAVVSPNAAGGQKLLTDIAFTVLYVSNWITAFQLYEMSFLAHTWSLAIEEQFYTLFPLAMIHLLRRLREKRKLLLALALLIAASFLIRSLLAASGTPQYRLYTGLDTRGETLLAGCLLGAFFAYAPSPLANPADFLFRPILRYLAAAACVGIAGLLRFGNIHDIPSMVWGLPFVELCTIAILLDMYLSPASLIKPVLTIKPLVWTGKLSYALYLWHVPLLGIIDKVSPLDGYADAAITAVLSLALAVVSYRLVELPALKLKRFFQPVPTTRADMKRIRG